MGWDEQFAAYNDQVIAALNAKWKSRLAITCYACPVQVEGPLADGQHLYFRERWGEWHIGLGATQDEAVTNMSGQGGQEGTPGGMSLFQVAAVIDHLLAREAWKEEQS
jgi:hypothetical protein